jgi:hypothetical protein
MDKIISISEHDGDARVQAGVKWEDLNAHLAKEGVPLFFPLDPGPGATIGGMVGTGCSGTNAVRYGTAKAEWFLNLVSYLSFSFTYTPSSFTSDPDLQVNMNDSTLSLYWKKREGTHVARM